MNTVNKIFCALLMFATCQAHCMLKAGRLLHKTPVFIHINGKLFQIQIPPFHPNLSAQLVHALVSALTPITATPQTKNISHTRLEDVVMHGLQTTHISPEQSTQFKHAAATIKNCADFAALIDQLISLFPELRNLYHDKNSALYKHITLVYLVFNRQYQHYQPLLSRTTKNLLHLIIALHDIGKPIAIREKKDQHQVTIPMMQTIMQRLSYSTQEIETACAIVSHDIIGQLVRGQQTVEIAKELLKKQAEKSHLSTDEFAAAQSLFYIADANAHVSITYSFEAPTPKFILPADINYLLMHKRDYINLHTSRGFLAPKKQKEYKELIENLSPDFFQKIDYQTP